MSNANNTEAKTIKEELEQLEDTQTTNGRASREVEEIKNIAVEIYPDVLERFKRELEGKSAEDIELFIYSVARDTWNRRYLEQLPHKVASVQATDWRVIMSNVGATVVGIGLFALGAHYVPQLLEGAAPNEELPGTDSNPFSDTTVAAPARPSKRRDNVVPFDRSAS